MQSVTHMHNCTHDCHQCFLRETLQLLEGMSYTRPDGTQHIIGCDPRYERCTYSCTQARPLIERAKAIDPDCIPAEEAE